MIVRMQRVAVLCTASSEQETLDALQSLGVLHLDADNRSEAEATAFIEGSISTAMAAYFRASTPEQQEPANETTSMLRSPPSSP